MLVVIVGGVLPYTRVAATLGLVPLPPSYFAFVAVVVVTFLGLVELVKHRVVRRLTSGDVTHGVDISASGTLHAARTTL